MLDRSSSKTGVNILTAGALRYLKADRRGSAEHLPVTRGGTEVPKSGGGERMRQCLYRIEVRDSEYRAPGDARRGLRRSGGGFQGKAR